MRVARRQVASRNPLKALAAREDIKSEYMEVKMGTGEKELRRMKVEERKHNSLSQLRTTKLLLSYADLRKS